MKSFRVQACRTALSCSLGAGAAALGGSSAEGAFGAAAGSSVVAGATRAGALGLAVGTARAGASGFTVIALTADRQGVDNFASLPTRHFKAALVPGCTSEQFATKSERQAARMAARCSSVSCLAARVCEMPTRRRTESREDLNMQQPSRTCPSWRFTENRDLPICHHAPPQHDYPAGD